MIDEESTWPAETVSLCLACAKHPEIRALVVTDLSEGVCGVCSRDTEKVFNPAEFRRLRNLIRALIRLHFNEDAYNGHWGGTSVSEILLDKENPLLETSTSSAYADDFIERIEVEGGVYPDYEEGICLYAGSDEESGRLLQFSIAETRCSDLLDIERRLERENFHRVEPAMEALFERIAGELTTEIDEGDLWFRSRTGVQESSIHFGFREVTRVALPYMGSEIGALSPPHANPGRTNRQGVSVLYLATDIETAMAEIRPHPGHLISVGGFRTTRKLSVASFDQPITKFCSSDQRLDVFSVIYQIGLLLGTPVTPEQRHRYAATQLLGDLLIRKGFDGVAFGSSVGPGTNLCVFDPSLFRFDERHSCVRAVDRLEYAFSEVAMAPPTGH